MGSVGKAHGKLLLFGEHSAVYGHPAVGVSLPEQTTVRLDDCGGPGFGTCCNLCDVAAVEFRRDRRGALTHRTR